MFGKNRMFEHHLPSLLNVALIHLASVKVAIIDFQKNRPKEIRFFGKIGFLT